VGPSRSDRSQTRFGSFFSTLPAGEKFLYSTQHARECAPTVGPIGLDFAISPASPKTFIERRPVFLTARRRRIMIAAKLVANPSSPSTGLRGDCRVINPGSSRRVRRSSRQARRWRLPYSLRGRGAPDLHLGSADRRRSVHHNRSRMVVYVEAAPPCVARITNLVRILDRAAVGT